MYRSRRQRWVRPVPQQIHTQGTASGGPDTTVQQRAWWHDPSPYPLLVHNLPRILGRHVDRKVEVEAVHVLQMKALFHTIHQSRELPMCPGGDVDDIESRVLPVLMPGAGEGRASNSELSQRGEHPIAQIREHLHRLHNRGTVAIPAKNREIPVARDRGCPIPIPVCRDFSLPANPD